MPSNLQNNPVEILDKFEVFLFDWDGTVSNTWPEWLKLLVHLYKELYGLDISEKQVTDLAGDWNPGPKMGIPEGEFDVNEWRKACDEHSVQYIAQANLYPGVIDFLRHLKRKGKKIGVVTSSSQNFISACLVHHKLEDFFDIVVSADDVTAHKPDPEPIFHALELLEEKPADAIMLGDMIQDIRAANSAGVASLFFDPPQHVHHDSEKIMKETKPTYVLSSWEELLKK